MPRAAVFLDRDGVINVCAPPHDYIKRWSEFQFLPQVDTAIAKLNKKRIYVFVVTNQRGVARGLMTVEDVDDIHRHMRHSLMEKQAVIDDIFVCPHESGTCHCRKPDIGLFLQAEQQYDIDKTHSFMIGDSVGDIQAGKKYGITTISIGSTCFDGDYHFYDLNEAVDYILGGNIG